ncbi:MAG: tRNA (adenosine(37)-N6)-threonylcarbamoyltransferase complex ATPase subunit type 1 TsaE [Cytophagales bacterium]|nr:tRNA (adenosine(37)-N6)-threonylcarbamoyltransferase complex ATPase subunit type 1 TsaE [Cytophagales bacterium]
MEIVAANVEALNSIAQKIYESFDGHTLWLLEGPMGVGKTTFTRAVCNFKGVDENVTSPTFSIINEYRTRLGETIYHFDFYRLNSEEEAEDIGVSEYFYSGKLCLIEWPSKIPHIIPSKHLKIELLLGNGNERIFRITPYGD